MPKARARACSRPGKRFVKHWMHGAHLLVEGKKMSKSLGNFYVLRDLTAKGFTGREIRYLLLTAHYRETFNFTMEGLQSGRTALARIDECLAKLREVWRAGANRRRTGSTTFGMAGIRDALDDDLKFPARGVHFRMGA